MKRRRCICIWGKGMGTSNAPWGGRLREEASWQEVAALWYHNYSRAATVAFLFHNNLIVDFLL